MAFYGGHGHHSKHFLSHAAGAAHIGVNQYCGRCSKVGRNRAAQVSAACSVSAAGLSFSLIRVKSEVSAKAVQTVHLQEASS